LNVALTLSTIRRYLNHLYFSFYLHTERFRRHLQLTRYINYLPTYLLTYLFAETAAHRKMSKYTLICQQVKFFSRQHSRLVETPTPLCMGGRSTAVTGDPRDTSFLWQRISVLLQCCNSTSISETFVDLDEAPDL